MRQTRFSALQLNARALLLGVGYFVLAIGFASQAVAKEDVSAFLEGLRKRGNFETAIEYIDLMKTSSLIDADTKASLPIERARIQMGQAFNLPNPAQQEAAFLKSIKSFEQFSKSFPTHPQAIESARQAGHLYQLLAEKKLKLAEKPGSKKKALRAKARGFQQKAQTLFLALLKKVEAAQEALKKPGAVPPAKIAAERQRLMSLKAGIDSQLAEAIYQIALTYEKGSAPYKKQMAVAAENYETFYGKYSNLTVGWQAIIRAGRAYRGAGDQEAALSCFLSIIEEATTQDATDLELRFWALREAIPSWLAEAEAETKRLKKDNVYDKTLTLSNVKIDEKKLKIPHVKAVVFARADIFKKRADLLAKSLIPGDKKKRKEYIASAIELASIVATHPGEFQTKAHDLLRELGANIKEPEEKKPTNFAEALAQVRPRYQAWTIALGAAQKAKPEAKAELEQKSVDQLEKTYLLLRMALELADEDTRRSELNFIQSRLCVVYWFKKQYAQAAVIGEHMAHRYPSSEFSKAAADTALKSWDKLAKLAGDDPAIENEKLLSLAKHISQIQGWTGSNEAGNAHYRLMLSDIAAGDMESAEKHLDKISGESPYRVPAQLNIGPRLWQQYDKMSRKIAKLEKQPKAKRPRQEIAELKAKATSLLGRIEVALSESLSHSLSSGRVNSSFTFTALNLAQAYDASNKPAEAVTWLEAEKIGPLTLLRERDPLYVKYPTYATRAFRLAIKSYGKLLAQQNGDEAAGTLVKLTAVMDELEKSNKDNLAAVVTIYFRLGVQLQKEMKEQQAEGLTDALKAVLTRITTLKDADYKALYWAGKSLRDLAEQTKDEANGATSQEYYGEASKAFQLIIKMAKRPGVKPQTIKAAQTALADCYRGQKKHNLALDILKKILVENENNIHAQIAAAHTLQDQKEYFKAWAGDTVVLGRRNKKEIKDVWGWSKISQRLRDHMGRFEEEFYLAYYRSNECKALLAIDRKTGAEEKTRLLKKAQSSINRLKAQFPALGGAKIKHPDGTVMKAKFKELSDFVEKRL